MAEQSIAPLSLRDCITQLEQAAQSPLSPPSTVTSLRPTSTGVTPLASSNRLSTQPISERDDPLQSDQAKRPYAATRPNAAGKTAREGTASVPPPKPPRPVWISKAKGDTAVTSDTGLKEADDSRSPAAETRTFDNNDEPDSRLASDSTGARSPDTLGPPRPADSTEDDPRRTSLDSSSLALKPDLPSRPPKPPALAVASPDAFSAGSTRHASSPSPITPSPTSTMVPVKPAPGLPPRPAWARKQSLSPAPASDGTSRSDKPTTASGSPQTRSSTAPLRRDTTSTVKSVSSTSSSLSLAGPQGAPSRNSASPALPPRPRWTPPSSKPATQAPKAARRTEDASGGGDTNADKAVAARKRYDRLFERCLEVVEEQYGPTGGRLDGVMVVELWRRSRLDDARLRKIWNEVSTSESRQQGGLDRDEFARGMAAIDAELRKRWSE